MVQLSASLTPAAVATAAQLAPLASNLEQAIVGPLKLKAALRALIQQQSDTGEPSSSSS